jgi:uncharacterized membrane protein YedE/YeeE
MVLEVSKVSIDYSSVATKDRIRAPSPYWNPYLAGIGLGLVLLAAFVVMGRGLGASGAFSSTIAWLVNLVAPAHAQSNEYLQSYLGDGTTHPLKAWLVFEVLGVVAGALLSGLLAGRVRIMVEKGPRVSTGLRLLCAFAGGILMAFGAHLARGCTSGQALTGGALLNVGSWAFMLMVFVGGYAAAWFVRWQWR